MRAYESRRKQFANPQPVVTQPGFTLTQIIDQFYSEGVIPEFLPAELGNDSADELDADGNFAVDPSGRIDIDRMDRLESQLLDGVPVPDLDTIPVSAPVAPVEPQPSEPVSE